MTMDESDIERLKNLVEGDTDTKKDAFPTVREHKYPPVKPIKKERIEESIVTPSRMDIGGGKKDTHTFVKLDGHISIANDLIDSKRDIKGIAATIALLSRAEKIRTKAIVRLEDELNKLSVKINDIENKMTVEGYSLMPSEYSITDDVSVDNMEESSFSDELGDLRNELDNLKRDIGTIIN